MWELCWSDVGGEMPSNCRIALLYVFTSFCYNECILASMVNPLWGSIFHFLHILLYFYYVTLQYLLVPELILTNIVIIIMIWML